MLKLLLIWKQFISVIRTKFHSIKTSVILSIHKAKLKALLSKNDYTDFNTADSLGWTPIHRGIELANIEILNELIENGADVNLVDGLNRTPMNIAVHNENIPILKVLLQNGVTLNLYQEGFFIPFPQSHL